LTKDLDRQSTSAQKDILPQPTIYDIHAFHQSNEKLLLILDRNSGLAPYSHEFHRSYLDPQIISGFVSAMTSFLGFVTGEQQSSWKTVYGLDSVILVETGEWTFGVLAVSRETNEARHLLRRVLSEFEDCFEVLKNSNGIEGSAIRDFDKFARKLFADERVTNRTIIMRRPEWRTLLTNFDLPSTTYTVSKILLSNDKVQTVQEIADFLSLKIDKVIEHVSEAFWKNVVDLKFVPADYDILTLSEGASTYLFHNTNPLRVADESLKVIAQLDGRTQLSHLIKKKNSTQMKTILEDLGGLINRGFIQRISEKLRLALHNECILSALFLKGSRIIGNRNMELLFEKIHEIGQKEFPWINKIILTDQMEAHFIFEGGFSPSDLNEIVSILEFSTRELGNLLATMCGRNVVDRLLDSIRSNCKELWFPYRIHAGIDNKSSESERVQHPGIMPNLFDER